MFQPRAGVTCLMCHHSVLRARQRRIITRQLFEENMEVADRIQISVAPYEVSAFHTFIIITTIFLD